MVLYLNCDTYPPLSSPAPHLVSEATIPFSESSDALAGLLNEIPAPFADLFPSIEENNIPGDDEENGRTRLLRLLPVQHPSPNPFLVPGSN